MQGTGEDVRPFSGRPGGRWRCSHGLAMVAVAALVGLVTPGCAWLFGFNRANPTLEPSGTLAYPTQEPIVTHEPSVFVTAAPGYRSLGGIFAYHSGLIIADPNQAPDPAHLNDPALLLAFSRLVAAHHIDPLRGLTEADCIGDGDGPENPIVAQKVVVPEGEVGAGIACVRLRNPGATWIGSRLTADDRRAVAFVLLQRYDGDRVGAYTDVTRFAEQGGVLK